MCAINYAPPPRRLASNATSTCRRFTVAGGVDVIEFSDQMPQGELIVLDLAGDLGPLSGEDIQDVGLLRAVGG